MLLEILLIWIVGIPALIVCGAMALARRRERLARTERWTTTGFIAAAHPGRNRRLRAVR